MRRLLYLGLLLASAGCHPLHERCRPECGIGAPTGGGLGAPACGGLGALTGGTTVMSEVSRTGAVGVWATYGTYTVRGTNMTS